ncbi:hypothetical protein BDM02DRAFT_3192110 [Thelephora ganbajun]|uniref:Uncharacterized protein n=1 Tax=Thelephora ganbajun TaxID=370292 RepID=A0ACB6Z1Z9_THEGA|nr:hypothetical protein BDM02DRAFT_3192110 [Thelephora ganbajun]
MLICPAEGCTFTTKSDRALTTHLGKCKRAATELTLITEDVRQQEDDRQQAKQHKILSLERLEVVPEVEEPMDVDPEDDGQPLASLTPIDIPSPPVNAPGPSVSRFGRVRRLPAKYQDMEINSHEIGQSLSHMPSFRTWRQQREEAEIAEAERRLLGPPALWTHYNARQRARASAGHKSVACR